jgi:hypothetical protein
LNVRVRRDLVTMLFILPRIRVLGVDLLLYPEAVLKPGTLRLKITVTQKHIENGEACSSDSCPLALALKDAGFKNAFVGGGYIFFDSRDPDRYIAMRWDIYDFVRDFDTKKPVCPITFELRNIPPEGRIPLRRVLAKAVALVRGSFHH